MYKTKLCDTWCARRWCHRGTQCTYAHGFEDLHAHPYYGRRLPVFVELTHATDRQKTIFFPAYGMTTPKLPHVPLWKGAAYRLIATDTGVVTPVRLHLASSLPIPRVHTVQRLEDDVCIDVLEFSLGDFYIGNAPVSLELA